MYFIISLLESAGWMRFSGDLGKNGAIWTCFARYEDCDPVGFPELARLKIVLKRFLGESVAAVLPPEGEGNDHSGSVAELISETGLRLPVPIPFACDQIPWTPLRNRIKLRRRYPRSRE
jgi:hypothetical protein